MKYKCIIQAVDEEEVIIKIGNTVITGFSNIYEDFMDNEDAIVEIDLYGDLKFQETSIHEKNILHQGGYSYLICGILDIESRTIKSEIDFSITSSYLYEYGYLDQRYIELYVPRMDFCFD